jgi:molecular chaperone IbpA
MRNTLSLGTSTFEDLIRDFNRIAVGFEPTLRTLNSLRQSSATTFPPYDLEKISEHEYRLSMAVAGYSADDISIVEHDGVLTVEGKVSNDSNKVYLHKGIAGRSFKRVFYLDQYVRVQHSTLDNGILVIDFVQDVPEALKPKKITINSTPPRAIEAE